MSIERSISGRYCSEEIVPSLTVSFMSGSATKLEMFVPSLVNEMGNTSSPYIINRASGPKTFFTVGEEPSSPIIISKQRLNDNGVDPEKVVRMHRTYQPYQKAELISPSDNFLYITSDVYLKPYHSTKHDPELGKPGDILKKIGPKQHMRQTLMTGVVPNSNISSFLVSVTSSIFSAHGDRIPERFRYTRTFEISYSYLSDDLLKSFITFCNDRGIDLSKISGGLPNSEWITFLRQNNLRDIMFVGGVDVLDLSPKLVETFYAMLVGSYPPGFGIELWEIIKSSNRLNKFNRRRNLVNKSVPFLVQ